MSSTIPLQGFHEAAVRRRRGRAGTATVTTQPHLEGAAGARGAPHAPMLEASGRVLNHGLWRLRWEVLSLDVVGDDREADGAVGLIWVRLGGP